MPQAHTLTAPTSSRAHRLTPLVVIITAVALFAAALIYATVNDTPAPKHSAVNVSESSASTARPDESKVAAAIATGAGGIYDDVPTGKWEQYGRAMRSMSPAELDAAFGSGR